MFDNRPSDPPVTGIEAVDADPLGIDPCPTVFIRGKNTGELRPVKRVFVPGAESGAVRVRGGWDEDRLDQCPPAGCRLVVRCFGGPGGLPAPPPYHPVPSPGHRLFSARRAPEPPMASREPSPGPVHPELPGSSRNLQRRTGFPPDRALAFPGCRRRPCRPSGVGPGPSRGGRGHRDGPHPQAPDHPPAKNWWTGGDSGVE